jgi:hypothetical protein
MHKSIRWRLPAATVAAAVAATAFIAGPASADVPTNPDGTRTYLGTSTTASDPYAFRCSQSGFPQNIGYCIVSSSDMTIGPIRTNGGGKNYYPMNTTKIFYSDDGVAWQAPKTALTESKLGLANGADGQPTNHLWAPAMRFKSTLVAGVMKSEYWLYTPDITNADDALSSRIFVTYSTDIGTQFGNTNLPGTNVKVAQVTGAPAGLYMSDPEVFTDSTVVLDSDQSKDYLIWANGDFSTCGDISIRKMTSPTAITSFTAAQQDSVRIGITGIPTTWGKCTATAGRFSGQTVSWPYIEGASMFRSAQWQTQPGNGSLPGPYVLLLAIKPNSVPSECTTAKGQPGTANELLAYATASSPTGPFAYQGIIMCGSSTEWTNQATIEEVSSTNGKKRLVLIYHDGPDPATQTNNARQRRLHSEPLYSYGGKFLLTTRSADQAISSTGTRQWSLQKDKIVALASRKSFTNGYLSVKSDGSMLADSPYVNASTLYSWETLSTGTYHDGFQSRINGKWVQLRRNTDNKWWARGSTWGDWEQFDTQPVGANSRAVQMLDNRNQWVVNDSSGGWMFGSANKPDALFAPFVDVLAK